MREIVWKNDVDLFIQLERGRGGDSKSLHHPPLDTIMMKTFSHCFHNKDYNTFEYSSRSVAKLLT